MAYKINFESFKSNFSLPQNIVDDDFSKLDAVQLKVILLIYKNSDKNYSANLLSNLLNVPEQTIQDAIEYWIKKGILAQTESKKIIPKAVVLSKMNQPIAQPSKPANNGELSFLLECMENQLKRPITSVEYKSVVHILEYIKLPADVIIMAVEYCVSIEKANARYIEKVCASWADNGITSHELAEQYLNILKQSKSNESQVQTLFGIQNRNLIDSERDAINRWFHEYKFDIEIIKLAYERTISAISKLSFPYINKILSSWYEKGNRSLDDIIKNEGFPKQTKGQTSYDLDEINRYWDNIPKLT